MNRADFSVFDPTPAHIPPSFAANLSSVTHIAIRIQQHTHARTHDTTQHGTDGGPSFPSLHLPPWSPAEAPPISARPLTLTPKPSCFPLPLHHTAADSKAHDPYCSQVVRHPYPPTHTYPKPPIGSIANGLGWPEVIRQGSLLKYWETDDKKKRLLKGKQRLIISWRIIPVFIMLDV